jgi:hypothetical protein
VQPLSLMALSFSLGVFVADTNNRNEKGGIDEE